jgi:hypothetical protein
MTYPKSFILLIFEYTVTTRTECPFTASDIIENILQEKEHLKVNFNRSVVHIFMINRLPQKKSVNDCRLKTSNRFQKNQINTPQLA